MVVCQTIRGSLHGMATGFTIPDMSAPLDLEAHLAMIPAHATIKGMFFSDLVRETRKVDGREIGRRKYIGFKDYPIVEWVELLVETAQLCYPTLSVREGMRRLGRLGYTTFLESLPGKVMVATVGRDLNRMALLTSKIYAVTNNVGTAKLAESEEGRVVVELRNVWDFPESYNLGSFEAAANAFDVIAEIKVCCHSICDADLLITWRPKP